MLLTLPCLPNVLQIKAKAPRGPVQYGPASGPILSSLQALSALSALASSAFLTLSLEIPPPATGHLLRMFPLPGYSFLTKYFTAYPSHLNSLIIRFCQEPFLITSPNTLD